MGTLLDQFRFYRDEDKHECNLLLNRINALLTTQTLFVAAGSFLYSSLQGDRLQQKVLVTAVSMIAVLTALLMFVAIFLGCRVLTRWHRSGKI